MRQSARVLSWIFVLVPTGWSLQPYRAPGLLLFLPLLFFLFRSSGWLPAGERMCTAASTRSVTSRSGLILVPSLRAVCAGSVTTSRGGQVFWLIPTLIPCCRLVPTYSIFESMSGTSLMGSPNTGGTTPFWTWKGNWTPTTFLCQFRSDLTNAGVDSAEWIGTATAAIAISLLVADTTALPLLLDASLENAADTYRPCTFAAAPAGLAATGQLLHPGGRVLLRKHKRAERSLDATYDATPGVVAAAIILSAVSKNARYL